jgi:hypothetical protein
LLFTQLVGIRDTQYVRRQVHGNNELK